VLRSAPGWGVYNLNGPGHHTVRNCSCITDGQRRYREIFYYRSLESPGPQAGTSTTAPSCLCGRPSSSASDEPVLPSRRVGSSTEPLQSPCCLGCLCQVQQPQGECTAGVTGKSMFCLCPYQLLTV